MKRRIAAHRIEVLVRNRVSPINEFLQQLIPASISRVATGYAWPELNPEPVEIRSDPAGVRVAFVEGSIPEEFRAEESLELPGDTGAFWPMTVHARSSLLRSTSMIIANIGIARPEPKLRPHSWRIRYAIAGFTARR